MAEAPQENSANPATGRCGLLIVWGVTTVEIDETWAGVIFNALLTLVHRRLFRNSKAWQYISVAEY